MGESVPATFVGKARAELAQADALVPGASRIASAGGPFAAVALVKGEPGEGDRSSGRALGGEDRDAAARAIAALGYDGPLFAMVSRPVEAADLDAVARRVRLQIEAVEAEIVIALDAIAALDVAAAFGLPVLGFGQPAVLPGRVLLAVDGLEASLTDDDRKRAVWEQFKSVLRVPAAKRERDARGRPVENELF
ncbi:MAG: hypothetical protein ACYC77_08955 [Coriobacteriia bacterium]